MVALGWPRTPAGADGIVAFLTGAEGEDAEILAASRRLLPDYMIPGRLHRLETIPQNASGKADRKRLVAIHEERS